MNAVTPNRVEVETSALTTRLTIDIQETFNDFRSDWSTYDDVLERTFIDAAGPSLASRLMSLSGLTAGPGHVMFRVADSPSDAVVLVFTTASEKEAAFCLFSAFIGELAKVMPQTQRKKLQKCIMRYALAGSGLQHWGLPVKVSKVLRSVESLHAVFTDGAGGQYCVEFLKDLSSYPMSTLSVMAATASPYEPIISRMFGLYEPESFSVDYKDRKSVV